MSIQTPRAVIQWAGDRPLEVNAQSSDGIATLFLRGDGAVALADRVRVPAGYMDIVAADVSVNGRAHHVILAPDGDFSMEAPQVGELASHTYYSMLISSLRWSPFAMAQAANFPRVMQSIPSMYDYGAKWDTGETLPEVCKRTMSRGEFESVCEKLTDRVIRDMAEARDAAHMTRNALPVMRHLDLKGRYCAIDSSLFTPLRAAYQGRHTIGTIAAVRGCNLVLESYLKLGGPVNVKTPAGLTLAEQAVLNKDAEAVKLLQSFGADMSALSKSAVVKSRAHLLPFDRSLIIPAEGAGNSPRL